MCEHLTRYETGGCFLPRFSTSSSTRLKTAIICLSYSLSACTTPAPPHSWKLDRGRMKKKMDAPEREREKKSPYSGPTWFVNIYLYCSTLYNTTIFSLHDPQVTVKNNTVQATLHPHHSCQKNSVSSQYMTQYTMSNTQPQCQVLEIKRCSIVLMCKCLLCAGVQPYR